MSRQPLYSRSSRVRPAGVEPAPNAADRLSPDPKIPPAVAAIPRPAPQRFSWLRSQTARWLATALLGALAGALAHAFMSAAPQRITQQDIDSAVLHTLQSQALPSPAAKAWEVIAPSLVRVRRLGPANGKESAADIGVGSGVVVLESGLILTNLHVVAGADSIKVVFADGLESDAVVVKAQPDQDLAVLQAKTLPDDLKAATLKSTAEIRSGDTVVAAGFPFGIGPSVTSGVVSGLKREFRSPDGKQILTNLIQFDAAVNPGSSGGPLMTPEGEVIGIVTAVLNPTEQRVFVGIGFAVPIESAAAGAGMSPF